MKPALSSQPPHRLLTLALPDLNGQARGKRMPISYLSKAEAGAARMPLSVLNVDIRGDDIADSPLVFETGDQDGVLHPTGREPVPMPWLDTPTALLPMWMFQEDGAAFWGDPRHSLDRVLSRFRDQGWQVLVGLELEFYLVDDSGEHLQTPLSPRSGKRRLGGEILSVRALDAYDAFFADLYEAADAMDIPAAAASSESGLAQYEIVLNHSDALKAADDAWLFKLLVKGLARKYGFAATFMTKPYPDQAGSGMHAHFSILDDKGQNVFDDGGPKGTPLLEHAVAGCLRALPASTLIFAPHGVSFDRFVPGAHAPTALSWAYENRTAALRVPSGPGAARRIEHRLPGADTNPYLVLAAILGAAMTGIEDGLAPPPPIKGNAYAHDLDQIPDNWTAALDAFGGPEIERIFDKGLIRNYRLTKTQEMATDPDLSPSDRRDLYLDTV